MAKKEYFKLIYLRQEDEDGDYWYAVHARSRHAEVAVMNASSIRGIKDKLLTFKTVEDAEALMNSGSLPNMGGVWEIVSKWIPKPVSSAQRNLSRQYCQRKRQLAGASKLLEYLCVSKTAKVLVQSAYATENARLDVWYEYELARLEKKND